MSTNINYELLAKYFSGECSEEEKKSVQIWLSESPGNQKIIDAMKKIWSGAEENFEPSNINRLWNELAQKAGIITAEEPQHVYKSKDNYKNRLVKFWFAGSRGLRYAAVIILVCLISLSVYLIMKPGDTLKDTQYKLISVDAGQKSAIILSDGTKITLDSGSELYYPEEFTSAIRKVKLFGEAFLEVAPNTEMPFEVEANNAVITVLGTKFNIRTWDDKNNVQINVTQGKVSLAPKNNPNNNVILEKGFGSNLLSDGTITEPYAIDIEKTMLWLKGEMYFDNAAVSEVIAQIERWYDVKIIISDPTTAQERITVHIDKKSLDSNLDLLTQLLESRYEITGREISILPLSN